MYDPELMFGVPRCMQCSYPLVGLSPGKCPECGRAFDIANPATVSFGRRFPRPMLWVLASPSWLFCLVSACTVVWAVIAFSGPIGPNPVVFLFGVLSLGGIAICYVVRLLIAIGASAWLRQRPTQVLRPRKMWLLPALLLVLSILIATSRAPAIIRFRASQARLEAFAHTALTAGTREHGRGQVGLYSFSDITVIHGAVYFHMSQYGVLDWPILVYSPSGPPSQLPARTYGLSHYKDSWYIGWFRF
jgi:hypothetical protein